MKFILNCAVTAMLLVAANTAVAAENLAVIIGNKEYRFLTDAREAYAPIDAGRAFRDAGFEVLVIRDLTTARAAETTRRIENALQDADRVVFIVAGHVVSSDRGSWLLGSRARTPDANSVAGRGLSIDSLLDLAGTKAGGAAVLIGTPSKRISVGRGLSYGYVAGIIPQGVTVFSGPIKDLAGVARNGLLKPGRSTREIADDAPSSIATRGFISSLVAFLPGPKTEVTPPRDNRVAGERERLIWQRARVSRSVPALQEYLDLYPRGQYANLAESLLDELQKSPIELAQEAEAGLGLDRAARRDIQRNLSLLGFNPRGIDGVFGAGTRAAMRDWQDDNNFDPTGYMSGNQITALQAAAAIRARELEEQARIKQEEQDRQDAIYWRETGRDNTERGLRAYLERYPDGLYSEIAQDRLEVFDERSRAESAAQDRDAWQTATQIRSAAAYREYLQRFPNGAYAGEAQTRLTALTAPSADTSAVSAAKRAEERLRLNGQTRVLIENRLASLGLKPGAVDGQFDARTRRAIRRYQDARNMAVTGYLTQATLVRLLADSLLR